MANLDDLETTVLLDRAVMLARSDAAGEGEDRWAAVVALHRRGSPDVHAAAMRWCRSEEPALRSLGADVLGQLGFKDGYPFAAESTDTLLQLLPDREPRVVSSSLVALGHLGVGDAAIISALAEHESADVRHSVAYCLGRRDETIAIDTLIRLSADADADVRDWATFALGSLSEADSPSLRDALAERLSDPDADVRGEAMRGLAVRHDDRATGAILTELVRSDGSDLALEAAAAIPPAELLPLLEALHAASPGAGRVSEALEECRRAATDDDPRSSPS